MELLAAGRWTPLITQALVYGIVLVVAMFVQFLKGEREESPAPPPIPRHATGVRLRGLTISDSARCPVCRTAIDPGARVLCTACATPHHQECWRYNTGCAMFACGERNSAV